MRALLAIAAKDLRLLVRDRGALFWAGVFPVLFAVLFAAVFPSSSSAPSLSVAVSGDAPTTPLFEPSSLTVTHVASAEEGRGRVRRGEAVAAIDITAWGANLVVDPTHPAEGAVIEAAVTRAMASSACGVVPVVRRTLGGESAVPSGFALAFPAAVLWGLIGCAGAFATASVAERRSGTYLRLRASPISTASIIGGKVLACLTASIADALLLLFVARLAFHVPIEGFSVLPLAIGSCAICFAGITVLLGSLGRSEQSVGGAGWAILLLFAMIGGAMVPLSSMPTWLRIASDASPVKWGIIALEGATFRRLTVRELLPSCAVLLGVGAACLASAAGLARKRVA